jgi:hypothetical protein
VTEHSLKFIKSNIKHNKSTYLIEGNTLTARGLLVFVSLTSGARSLYKTASDGDGREDDGSPTWMVVEIRVHESTPRERLGRPPGKSKVITHTSLTKWGETS